MISMLLAAAMDLSPVVITQSATGAPPARYVRLRMTVNGYGIDGRGSLLVDRQSGRYFEHIDLGPQSSYQGFDGTRVWQSDVNGTTAVQGNAFDRGTALAWGYLFAFPRPSQIQGSNVRYRGVLQAASIRVDPASHLVQRFVLFNGAANEVATFSEYRSFSHGITAPAGITFTDDNGTIKIRVTSADPLAAVPSADFAPPPRAHDSSLIGAVTSVPFAVATEILVPVRIDNGPEMHFILDTGGQNVLLGSSAKRLNLHTIGHGTVGGAGAGVVPTSFVTVRSVRVGAAEMRNQPFLVLSTPIIKGVDGIIGFELLSRFAARVDYRTNTVSLASSIPASWTSGAPATPFGFRSRQPQVDGSIDGIAGAITIDTGNSGVLDINSPFAAKHHLWAKYHAAKPKPGSLAGVGGSVNAANVTVRHLQLGSAALENVYADLTQATAGIEAHPGFAANAGEGIFRTYTFVIDYAHQRLYFAPGGVRDRSGLLLARNGNRIVVQDVRTHLAMRQGVRAGMTLTAINGKAVEGADIRAVQASLEGRPGSTVNLVFDGTKHVKLLLLNYL